jgi:hypothetical protein
MKVKIAILGAGCSCAYGYPLAIQMKGQLAHFAKSIENSAPKLHKLAFDTLGLFDKLTAQGCPAQTLDDLAWLIHQGKIPAKSGTFQDEHGHRLVEEAKAVVSAMFLAKKRIRQPKRWQGTETCCEECFLTQHAANNRFVNHHGEF